MSYPEEQPRQQPPPTVVAASGTGSLGIQKEFLMTPISFLLIAEMVFGVIAIGCGAQGTTPHGGWFLFVAIVAWLTAIGWFIVFLMNVPEAKPNIPWLMIYLIYNGVAGSLYLIAFIVILALAAGNSAYIAAGVFGILLTVCYGVSGFFTFQKIRA